MERWDSRGRGSALWDGTGARGAGSEEGSRRSKRLQERQGGREKGCLGCQEEPARGLREERGEGKVVQGVEEHQHYGGKRMECKR